GVGLTLGTRPSFDFPYYSVERVKGGGCGLIVNSLTVNERASAGQSSPYLEDNIPAFKVMADTVHEAGGTVFGEIWYWWGVTGSWQPLSPPAPSLGASVVQFSYGGHDFSTREMTRADIAGMAES